MSSCTVPTLPGLITLATSISSSDNCGCLDPDKPTLILVSCKEGPKGKMIRVEDPNQETHKCCDLCLRAVYKTK